MGGFSDSSLENYLLDALAQVFMASFRVFGCLVINIEKEVLSEHRKVN